MHWFLGYPAEGLGIRALSPGHLMEARASIYVVKRNLILAPGFFGVTADDEKRHPCVKVLWSYLFIFVSLC